MKIVLREKMDLWIRKHLQQNSDPRKVTHFYAPLKNYIGVPITDQAEFWMNFCDTVNKGSNPSLYEMTTNRENLQLGFDVKLSFERQQVPTAKDVVVELVESIESYVQHIIGVVQSLIISYFEPTNRGSEYIACYLRRDDNSILTWHTNTVEYSGRIIFPYARIHAKFMTKFYHFVLNQLQLNGDTPDEHLSLPPINGFDTLLHPLNSEMLEMYGSSINEETPPLKLYEIYGLLNTDVKTTFELSKIFIPTLHAVIAQGLLSQQHVIQKIQEKGLNFWLPLFFSVGFFDSPLKAKDGIFLTETEAPKITMTVIKESGEALTKIERARQLLTFLAITRVDHNWSWMDIGHALHSVESGKEGLQLWKWATSQSDFKSDEDCDILWHSFNRQEDVTIETLEYFASIDNPEKYESFREAEVREAINRAIHLQENTPVAKAFKACFPFQFVCANYDSAEWYFFDGTRWVHVDGNSTLMWFMNEKFQLRLEQIQVETAQKIATSRDAEYKSRNQHYMDLISELIKKISKNGFKKSVCEELKIYYHKPNFKDLKDMNPNYMATPTGLIDLRGDKAIVRQAKPQDYVTKCTRYGYPHNYTWDSPAVKMVLDYIGKVFRSKTLRDYFWKFSSSLMFSGNKNKLFPIFSGTGNNSKSILVRLFEMAFGSYSVKLPTSLITEKRTAADSATPTLIHARGAKIAFLQEPNKKDIIQSGTVKELTSGGLDTIYVRDLFQKGSQIVEMDVTIVPILVANKIPVIPDCQEAIWGRTRVLDFTGKWTNDASKDPEEQFRTGIFPLDKFFDRQIPIMAPAFLWILVQKYEEYIEEGLKDSPEVLQATENFRVANNFYIHFTRDSIKYVLKIDGSQDLTAFVTLDELFNTFRKWYADQQYRAKMPNKTEFKEDLEMVWKQKADAENKWYGLQLNNQANTIQSLLQF